MEIKKNEKKKLTKTEQVYSTGRSTFCNTNTQNVLFFEKNIEFNVLHKFL